jgi:predicted metalloprotease with PDZ domain
MRLRPSPISLFIWLLLPEVLWAQAPKPRLVIEHTVSVTDPATKLFHVKSRFADLRQSTLVLALPVWTPGSYVVLDYARNVLRMRFTDGSGRALSHHMTRKSTWEVDTRGVSEVRVEFDYVGDKLDVDRAKVAPDYAIFTGAQLFLEPVGHRASPATVRFAPPPGWRVLSALQATPDSMVFRAADYDELVDAPTQFGLFDLTRFVVDGIPHFFSVMPIGTLNQDETTRFIRALTKITRASARVFGGGQPFEKFISFTLFHPVETSLGSGALEHLNSQVAMLGPRGTAPVEQYLSLFAHEIFHAWNVKRLRPEEMWPYDYSDAQETPLLWFSEGVTNYYAELVQLRPSVISDSAFLQRTARAIGFLEGNQARKYKSLADASVSQWLGYTEQAFPVDYYIGGQTMGTLLDILILGDTRGLRSLDDVMRQLWNNEYKRGSGFTTAELIAAINRVSGRNHDSFVRRYIHGTEIPPYDSIFSTVGYRLEIARHRRSIMGVLQGDSTALGPTVRTVTAGGPYETAGGKAGDIIVSIDGKSPFPIPAPDLIGKDVVFVISRDGERRELKVRLASREDVTARLVPLESPTSEQLTLRRKWLGRTP